MKDLELACLMSPLSIAKVVYSDLFAGEGVRFFFSNSRFWMIFCLFYGDLGKSVCVGGGPFELLELGPRY